MDSAALDKVLHDLAAQSKDKPVSDLEKNVVGMILDGIKSNVGTVDRNNNTTLTDIQSLLCRMETTTLTRGTVTKSDLEFEKSLKNTEHIVREDETEVGMQLLLQRMSTQNIKTDGKTKKVFDDYASKRTKAISNMFKQKKKLQMIDMCFLLDTTGSMGPHINEVKQKIKFIVTEVQNKHHDAQIRFAAVTYRGKGQGNERIDFMDRESEFIARIQSLTTGGGSSGGAEDVYSGMKMIAGLSWKNANRLLNHIGDMPTHGRKYSLDAPCDNYPDENSDIKSIFDDWTSKVIRYTFFKITDYCDAMLREFSKIAPADFDFQVKELKEVSHLANVIRFTATATINTTTATHLQPSRSVSVSHMRTGREKKTEQQRRAAENFTPFAGTCRIQMMSFNITRRMLLDCVESEYPPKWLYEVDSAQLKNEVQVDKPQGFGANRMALSCLLHNPCPQLECGANEAIVIKEYFVNKYSDFEDRKKDYSHQTVSSAISFMLAEEFNKSPASDGQNVAIKFIPAGLVQIATMKNGSVDRTKIWNCEKMIKGEFQKFTNNVGDYFPDIAVLGSDSTVFDQLIEFSMFTYEFTKGTMMIVDLQGEYDETKRTFTLTDPVVLCENVTIFGNTNTGAEGIEKCKQSYDHYLTFLGRKNKQQII